MSPTARFTDDVRFALRHYFRLRKVRTESTLARFAITSVFAIGFPSLFLAFGALFGSVRMSGPQLLASYVCGFVVAFLIHGGYRLTELVLSQPALDRLQAGGWRAGLYFTCMPIGCIALGMWLFSQALGWSMDVTVTTPFDSARGLSQFLFLSLIGSLIGWYLDHQRRRRQALQLQASEARLLRLQAQIEPHFLFNSLAAVQSLVKPAPDRALEMLEHFTDYLRASLGALREESCALATELQVARSYLGLMQIRMGERLRFSLSSTPEADAQRLPPLLLQPLVENAIVHGLEGKDDGGEVQVSARIVSAGDGRWLQIEVRDDGLGANARQHRARPGHGLALKNIRERLAARYGDQASLALTLDEAGACAVMRLPLAPPSPRG
ncbi:histidine kinase [Pelomonas sp. APW6]|uniref:Histidine kinase n=1 Tax=Roseateles subflavus TaxID=3053353 RepID=A0ABT7LNT8_9BURK|nr:histidine kinase [Pelomonas sp. APW6]MDL5034538.1 histidine kinase [Pelomonas sp. APW6]